MAGTYLALALAGCGRLNFESHERSDASGGDGSGDAQTSFALACNVPVKLGSVADPSSARISAIGAPGGLGAVWISDAQKIANVGISLDAPDLGHIAFLGDGTDLPNTYDLASLAVTPSGMLIGVGRNTSGISEVRVLDATTLQPVTQTGTTSPIGINTPHAATTTGTSTGAIFAVTGKNGTQSAIFGVDAQNSIVGAPLNIGVADRLMGLLNAGSRLAIINDSNANNCECRTAQPDLSSFGAAATYGGGSCNDPVAAYIAGRNDLLFVTHDINAGRLERQILTISGTTVSLGTVLGLRDNSSGPRATGNTTLYWTLYQNGTMLEATSISVNGTIGTRVPLGAVANTSAYDVTSAGADSYAFWLSSGLNLVRLCP